MQSQPYAATSLVRSMRELVRSSPLGYRALYRGFMFSSVGSAPATSLYLALYNQLKTAGNSLADQLSLAASSLSLSLRQLKALPGRSTGLSHSRNARSVPHPLRL